jgi:hypothetical protein
MVERWLRRKIVDDQTLVAGLQATSLPYLYGKMAPDGTQRLGIVDGVTSFATIRVEVTSRVSLVFAYVSRRRRETTDGDFRFVPPCEVA